MGTDFGSNTDVWPARMVRGTQWHSAHTTRIETRSADNIHSYLTQTNVFWDHDNTGNVETNKLKLNSGIVTSGWDNRCKWTLQSTSKHHEPNRKHVQLYITIYYIVLHSVTLSQVNWLCCDCTNGRKFSINIPSIKFSQMNHALYQELLAQ